jgi:hypothetical protein
VFTFTTATLEHDQIAASSFHHQPQQLIGWKDGAWLVVNWTGSQPLAMQAVWQILNQIDVQRVTITWPILHHWYLLLLQLIRTDDKKTLSATLLVSDGHCLAWLQTGQSIFYLLRHGRLLTKRVRGYQQIGTARNPLIYRLQQWCIKLFQKIGNGLHQQEALFHDHASGILMLTDMDVLLICHDDLGSVITDAELEIALAKASDPQHWLANLERIACRKYRIHRYPCTAIAIFVDQMLPLPPITG